MITRCSPIAALHDAPVDDAVTLPRGDVEIVAIDWLHDAHVDDAVTLTLPRGDVEIVAIDY